MLGQVLSEMLATSGIPQGTAEVASVIVRGYPHSTEGFALCLSEKGDLLSQWRAYANDGRGVSIGFDAKILTDDFGPVNFGSNWFELTKVEYGKEGLQKRLAPYVEKVRQLCIDHGDFIKLKPGITVEHAVSSLANRDEHAEGLFLAQEKDRRHLLLRLLKLLAPLHFQIYSIKPQTFHEENEWRLLRYRHRVPLEEIRYNADHSSIRPFIPSLIADPAKAVIREIVLGPKHTSNISWFRSFLAAAGLTEVEVRCSTITSYR